MKKKSLHIIITGILFFILFTFHCSQNLKDNTLCEHGFEGESGECVYSYEIDIEVTSAESVSNEESGLSSFEEPDKTSSEESYLSKNVIIVIIDGARYQETFGDPNRKYIPYMNEISKEGCINTQTYNDHQTTTIYGVNSIRSGTWESWIEDNDGTVYLKDPCVWEYYRKDKKKEAQTSFYVLKYISEENLWLCSYKEGYGSNYWPIYHSKGYTDLDVWNEMQWVMDNYHPNLSIFYLADVDSAGHSGVWENYISAIETADQIVGKLWEKIQTDPYYQDQTTLIVTNDHGRHDDLHGGFQNHGDSCEGCRHVMLLIVGPVTPQGCVIENKIRKIIDIVPTVGTLLGFDPKYSTGEVMEEVISQLP